MHHKFAIIDSAIVWTGSCNMSDSGTGGYNANTALVIRSKVVAGWYADEFNAMYEDGLYHHKKSDLGATTQRRVVLDDGVTISLGFSPQDKNYVNLIGPALRNAQETIDVAMFFMTHKLITADLINAHQRGVRVRVIIDATAATNGYTKHELLRVAGIPVKVESWGGKMHMKCALIDGRHLVAGSMNWTSAGERSNDENALLVSSTTVGRKFQSAFEKMWASIPSRWLSGRPDPESADSVGSASDGVDNDFDDLVDGDDPGCGESPPSLIPLPPYKVVPLADGSLLIKGNISRDGRKIYHLPSGRYYKATRIRQDSGERWFPSIWEAKEAGWRASKR
jgi:HKD family nuclease